MARGGITDPQLMGYKALSLASDLPGSARLVGAALLDHFNRKTGQCDPSHDRLADLLAMDARTVREALRALCDEAGADTGKLFERDRHGGKSHRTSYAPRWHRFDMILDEWARRMREQGTRMETPVLGSAATRTETPVSRGRTTRTETPASYGRKHPLNTDENTRQTRLSNPLKKPMGVSTSHVGPVDNAVDGLSKWGEGPAFEAALNGLTRDVSGLPDGSERQLLFGLDENAWGPAVKARLSDRAAGIRVLREAASRGSERSNGG